MATDDRLYDIQEADDYRFLVYSSAPISTVTFLNFPKVCGHSLHKATLTHAVMLKTR